MSTMTSEREAFEKWADDQGFPMQRWMGGEDYQDSRTQAVWDAWNHRAHIAQPAQAVDVPTVDEHGMAFVEGLGWVVQCSKAAKYAATLYRALSGEKAGPVGGWISVEERRPERNKPAIYWLKSEFGGFAAIADEWRDEHHLEYATHWMPLPASPTPDKEG